MTNKNPWQLHQGTGNISYEKSFNLIIYKYSRELNKSILMKDNVSMVVIQNCEEGPHLSLIYYCYIYYYEFLNVSNLHHSATDD